MSTSREQGSSRNVKAKEEKEKEDSRTGVYLATTTGSLRIAFMVITVQGIIQGDSQEDARSVDPLDITPLNAPDQLSRRRGMPSMSRTLGKRMSNGKSLHGRLRSTKPPKARSKPQGKSKGKSTPRSITPRPAQTQTPLSDRPHPKAKPEARICC